MNNLDINTDLTAEIIIGFIQSETTQAGFSKAVIGVSGGVDSALACFLAARALGGKNVLAVRMPYKTSSQASFLPRGWLSVTPNSKSAMGLFREMSRMD